MKRKIFIVSFLISSWFLNIGFLFKPNIKVLTCGDNDYISNISSNDWNEIYKDYPWIFDSKSGQIYAFDQYKKTLRPIESEIIEGYEYVYKDIFVREGIVYIDSVDRELATNETYFTKTLLDFEKLKVTYIMEDGRTESNCKEINLPKDIKILK
tara:strand:- start:1400 stop:1861 length:462 start_codon:yes stop_codon:yes gene_type:complete